MLNKKTMLWTVVLLAAMMAMPTTVLAQGNAGGRSSLQGNWIMEGDGLLFTMNANDGPNQGTVDLIVNEPEFPVRNCQGTWGRLTGDLLNEFGEHGASPDDVVFGGYCFAYDGEPLEWVSFAHISRDGKEIEFGYIVWEFAFGTLIHGYQIDPEDLGGFIFLP